ncbi:MAG: DUF2891 domain-containing protein [Thermoflexales bacterium]
MALPDLISLTHRFLPVTLSILHREYPNGLALRLRTSADVGGPRALHPAFFGCYDWHSAVHSHWQLARVLRLFPGHPLLPAIIAALDASLNPAAIAGEMAYFAAFPGFETPYGTAWVLELARELRLSTAPEAARWRNALAPLEAHAARALLAYALRLPLPVRTGMHNQTAFALGLALDWSTSTRDGALRDSLADRVRRFYLADRDAPLAYEPSAADFLSPALAEADLMRRVLAPAEFAAWLNAFLGADTAEMLAQRLPPARVADYADGQLAHFCGLNLSRSWMLRDIARALAWDNPLRKTCDALANAHLEAGWQDALHADDMVSHWAPSFLLYALAERDSAE